MKEQASIAEIKKEELVDLVNSLSFEDQEKITFNGSRYLLWLFTEEDMNTGDEHEKVFYSASTADRGCWDIYMLENLSDAEKKRSMFHEILECNLKDRGFDESLTHELALKAEEEVFGQR